MNINNIVTATYPPIDPIIVGKIGKAYGVQGWMKIISFTDNADNLFNYNPWFVLFQEQWKLIRLECWKSIKKCYIAKIFGVSSREMAILLIHCDLVINGSQLPSLSNKEYYWKDIIGCKVVTIQGNNLGYIDYITETCAYDILVVKIVNTNSIQKINYFIPFIQGRIIKHVNLVENIVIVDWNNNF